MAGGGQNRRTTEAAKSSGGGDRQTEMGGDGAMNSRYAAVTVRWSREDGGSGSSPVFPDVQEHRRSSRGREGVNEKGNRQSGNVALQRHQLSALLSLSCLMLH